jgi:hypothetical protein
MYSDVMFAQTPQSTPHTQTTLTPRVLKSPLWLLWCFCVQPFYYNNILSGTTTNKKKKRREE